jgi:hypothetical protein
MRNECVVESRLVLLWVVGYGKRKKKEEKRRERKLQSAKREI